MLNLHEATRKSSSDFSMEPCLIQKNGGRKRSIEKAFGKHFVNVRLAVICFAAACANPLNEALPGSKPEATSGESAITTNKVFKSAIQTLNEKGSQISVSLEMKKPALGGLHGLAFTALLSFELLQYVCRSRA